LRRSNPDNPAHSAAADKIRNYQDTYHRNRQVACLPACMSTSGRIHGEFLRLLFFLSKKHKALWVSPKTTPCFVGTHCYVLQQC